MSSMYYEGYDRDDDEVEDKASSLPYKDRRREAHTQAEQKRRDAIKKGYDSLQGLVPTCQQSDISGYKMSKATVLQKSIDYIQFLLQQKKKQEEERNALRKDVVALQIMKANYEQMVKSQQNQPGLSDSRVSDELKFHVFQSILEQLFITFSTVSVNNFSELSACIFTWLEEHCKPQVSTFRIALKFVSLRQMVESILQRIYTTRSSVDFTVPKLER